MCDKGVWAQSCGTEVAGGHVGGPHGVSEEEGAWRGHRVLSALIRRKAQPNSLPCVDGVRRAVLGDKC